VTSEIADSVSKAYNNRHPDLDAQPTEVLMVGFRAAGWTCFVSTPLGIVIVIFGLRDQGIIGKRTRASEVMEKSDNDNSNSGQSRSSKKNIIVLSKVNELLRDLFCFVQYPLDDDLHLDRVSVVYHTRLEVPHASIKVYWLLKVRTGVISNGRFGDNDTHSGLG